MKVVRAEDQRPDYARPCRWFRTAGWRPLPVRDPAVYEQPYDEADAARLAIEVDRIRSEIRVGVKAPAGRIAAVDAAAMLLIGPQGAVGGALLRTLEVLVGKGRHPVPSLLVAGHWQDEAALRAALGREPITAGTVEPRRR
ncbi:hypothetical protein RSM1_22350 [Methylobacterium radiotolerans]|nr:hypothetical protein RSM1_22350 [Methylobacterium radiotolerans]